MNYNRVRNKDFIAPSLGGRLGNNMFMIAHAYAQALENNKQLVVPRNQVIHMQDFLPNIFRKIDVFLEMPDDSPKEATVYSGYFQSEKYFEKYSEAVKSLFSPTYEFVQSINERFPFMNDARTTSISVRRGDYLYYPKWHPVVTIEYLNKALTYIDRSDYYFVFSDDLTWCKEHLSHLKNIIYIDYPIHEQMWLMSMCDDFIISNSSFSWWGAYLSRTLDKKVIAPETWFGPSGPSTWEDMYCKQWVIIPTQYVNGFIYPKN